MRWLKFILSHSIFISLCASALAVQAFILYKIPVNVYACVLLFLLTLGSYNMYWILSKLSLRVNNTINSSLSNITLGMVAGAGTIIILALYPSYIPHLIVPVILTLLYSLPLWPWKPFKILRRAGFLKTILLSLAWTWNTLFLPLQVHISYAGADLWILFGARFFFMLMLCLIFDSRDVKVDKLHSLSSLATQLSSDQLKLFFTLTFLCFIAMGFAFRIMLGESTQLAAFVITGLVTWITYRLSSQTRGYYFYYFFVDGLMLFSSLATIVASIL